jgi:hypothetical protein
LDGDGTTTWKPDGRSDSWLEWLGHDIPTIAVWSLTYPAGATKWTTDGEGMALPDRAANLIPTMLYHDVGTRGIVFVCHSLGGLVVKQILRHSKEMAVPEWASIARSTLGVVFLATPHAGSNLATFAKVLSVSRPTRTLLALGAHCPHLKELGDWYRQNAGDLGIETAAYAESRKIRRGLRSMTVVTTTSANPGIEGCITTSIDADHIDICKPESRETDTYRGIESFIRRQLAQLEQSTLQDHGSSPESEPERIVFELDFGFAPLATDAELTELVSAAVVAVLEDRPVLIEVSLPTLDEDVKKFGDAVRAAQLKREYRTKAERLRRTLTAFFSPQVESEWGFYLGGHARVTVVRAILAGQVATRAKLDVWRTTPPRASAPIWLTPDEVPAVVESVKLKHWDHLAGGAGWRAADELPHSVIVEKVMPNILAALVRGEVTSEENWKADVLFLPSWHIGQG